MNIPKATLSFSVWRGEQPEFPDPNTLDSDALKALILDQHVELISRKNEIENLKLLILKLRRMKFERSSEKLDRQIRRQDDHGWTPDKELLLEGISNGVLSSVTLKHAWRLKIDRISQDGIRCSASRFL